MQTMAKAGRVGNVRIGSRELYAYYLFDGSRCRVRIGLDEREAMDAQPLGRVLLRLPGERDRVAYFRGIVEIPPFAWLEFDV